MDSILLVIVFPLVLFALGYYLNTLVIFHQFRDSIAGHRVKAVVHATREFSEPQPNTGVLRDRYRYGLGVIIDDLRQIDAHGLKNGKCPLLVDKDTDRWQRFDRYVRPVIDDIDPYSFLSAYAQLRPLLRQLGALTNLCRAIEVTVMELDASFENPQIVEWRIDPKSSSYEIEIIGNATDSRVIALNEALKDLSNAWNGWVDATKTK